MLPWPPAQVPVLVSLCAQKIEGLVPRIAGWLSIVRATSRRTRGMLRVPMDRGSWRTLRAGRLRELGGKGGDCHRIFPCRTYLVGTISCYVGFGKDAMAQGCVMFMRNARVRLGEGGSPEEATHSGAPA